MEWKWVIMVLFTLSACAATYLLMVRVNCRALAEVTYRFERERDMIFRILLTKKRRGRELVNLYDAVNARHPGICRHEHSQLVHKALYHYHDHKISETIVDKLIAGKSPGELFEGLDSR